LTRSFRIPLWASVQIDQHAMRNTGDNNSQALELIIDDWAATKRVRAKFGAEIDALIRTLETVALERVLPASPEPVPIEDD